MVKNASSYTVEFIRMLINPECTKYSNYAGNFLTAMTLWAYQVRPGGAWDHKPILDRMLDLKINRDYYFPIKGDFTHEYYYDIWSNMHYGFVGLAAEIGENLLQFGASVPSLAGTNDHGDVLSTSIGFELWKSYGLKLTAENLHMAILAHKNDFLQIQFRYPEEVYRVDIWGNGE